ncbi:MAG: hypothetical protein ACYTKD_24965 [Planctomycetota bacterium]|jgi:hypothetical protein
MSINIVKIDLDVDSDNNNHYELPERSSAEDAVEDVSGDDEKPGKVVIVDNGDSDNDGIVDYADGFNSINGTHVDDSSVGSKFVPIVLEVAGQLDESKARVEIDYDASDPAAITASMTEPFILPAGKLRVWIKDADQARSKMPVLNGGDYLAPDTYTLDQLGLSEGPATLYLEAVAESDETADLPITARILPTGSASGGSCEDIVRVTSARIQMLAHDATQAEPFEVVNFVACGLPDQEAAEGEGEAPGAVQSYTIKVFDPRANLDTLSIDDQNIVLLKQDGIYTTSSLVAGIPSEEEALLDQDKPYVLSLDAG